MRAVVFGYHAIGCVGLDALLRHGFDVRAVITHRDDPREAIWWPSIAERARAHGIPVVFRERAGDAGLAEEVAARSPDFLFSFYYRHLLPDAVLKLASQGALNLHGSLLPRYRGRAPVNWVLVHGESETGVTLHDMTSTADSGDIVAHEAVAISQIDTAYTLFRKLEGAATRVLDRTLPLLLMGRARRTPQDEKARSYFGARAPRHGLIDWSWPAHRVYNLVRAVTHPYPGAFTTLHGRNLYVWWATPHERGGLGAPGRIRDVSHEGIVVMTGEGSVRLVTVQFEGQPELPASAFALVEHIVPGDRLGPVAVRR